MFISNIFYETFSTSLAIPTLPHCRELSQKNRFDQQVVSIQDNHEALAKASTFIKYLERNLEPSRGSKSPLQALLELSLHLPATEENSLLFAKITEAFFKQKGYFSRLFSNESWEEWFENRTALGKVASLFRNCIESRAPVSSFTKEMYPQLVQKANEETNVLLKGLGSRVSLEVTKTSKSSCLFKLTSGIAASFLFKSSFPFLLGLTECFPRASAQQKVGNEFQVNTYTNQSQDIPSVASFPNGNFVVTWYSEGQDGSDYRVYGQLFDGNGTKIGNEFQASSYTNSSQEKSSVASFSNGNFVVTWHSEGQDGDSWEVYGQLFNGNGTKIGNEFRANSYITSYQWDPSVATLSNDNFVVTWQSNDQDGSLDGVYGQLFDGTGTKIGSEFRANSYTTRYQGYPSVASFSNGNFVVTWQSNDQDGSRYGIYGQLFNGTGTKLGSELRANSYTTSDQRDPSVATFSNGNFVVTWHSDGQDGSGYGNFGQIFHDNITYPSSSTTTSSSTTSTTKTTPSTTPSVRSSTMSATGRTRTSVNPSSRTTVLSTTRPITTSSQATLSATSDPSNRFSWVWFLLGGVGAVSCLGLTGYFIFKSRDRKKDGDVHALELGEREQTDDSTAKTHYQRTPDVVAAVCDYQFTPDVVAAGAEEEPLYGLTPDVVAAGGGGN